MTRRRCTCLCRLKPQQESAQDSLGNVDIHNCDVLSKNGCFKQKEGRRKKFSLTSGEVNDRKSSQLVSFSPSYCFEMSKLMRNVFICVSGELPYAVRTCVAGECRVCVAVSSLLCAPDTKLMFPVAC